ncbi:carboxypeptidase regulatory-like domain-containing protein [Mucilaginibacter sp. S1162]|uniref:Carboxypeptidase regulatory-like domain-containing protein n=1 Tax=Mucilaginibacter humi TaxID=2732510 RepID=A0ABX1W6Q7_9SPHI|nr:carboxypeptidase-like regulatory domain-containing protein [Mucilaginibacter humi]NNU34366.1 carboxypeptidase regulatory-like domain-containing protein [Mucilaginibacter humi]
MVFIDNHDELNIHITPNKTIYRKRDSVALTIEVKDKSGFPVQGSFSLTVTDDSQVRPDTTGNYSINTSLLLNADLKGNIENPGYYINRKDKQAWQALDNLMLTQGWTGYDWKNVFAPAKPPKFEAEKEFKITGRVTTLTNKPVAPGFSVLVSSQKPAFVKTFYTDENGRFWLINYRLLIAVRFSCRQKTPREKA